MSPVLPKRRAREPDVTRGKLLASAFEAMHRHGFQAASLDRILAGAGVTKGALYHHFPDKAALGYAVVEEIVKGPVLEVYLRTLEDSADPLAALQDVLRRRADDFAAGGVELGCPLNNLAQEMSPLDETFRLRVAEALEAWTAGYTRALERAKALGVVRRDVNPARVAAFIVAAVEGSFGMAKNARSVATLRSNLDTLVSFLDTLRPARPGGHS